MSLYDSSDEITQPENYNLGHWRALNLPSTATVELDAAHAAGEPPPRRWRWPSRWDVFVLAQLLIIILAVGHGCGR